jgi:hypothetical protein
MLVKPEPKELMNRPQAEYVANFIKSQLPEDGHRELRRIDITDAGESGVHVNYVSIDNTLSAEKETVLVGTFGLNSNGKMSGTPDETIFYQDPTQELQVH